MMRCTKKQEKLEKLTEMEAVPMRHGQKLCLLVKMKKEMLIIHYRTWENPKAEIDSQDLIMFMNILQKKKF